MIGDTILRKVAASEVRALLTDGYHSVGAVRCQDKETYVLRHHNGNVVKVVLTTSAVNVIKNNLSVKSFTQA